MDPLSPVTPRSVLTGRRLLALAGCLTLTASAADWTTFRGPNSSGVAPEFNLPADLERKENLAWYVELPGEGLASPIIVGDRVFVTASSGPKQQRLHVLCYHADTGEKLWERRFWATGRTMCHDKTSVAAPTPASDGQYVYAFFSSNDLICLDLEGNLVWLRGLTRDYPNASNSLGMSSSPVVTGDVVVVQLENDSESFAAGIDTATGVNRWKINRPKKASWTSPVVLPKANGKSLVALQGSAGVTVIDPKDGSSVWSFDEGASTIPTCTPGDDVLFVPSNGITALQATGDSQPKELWRSGQLRPATASPVVAGDRIYVLNGAGVLSCGDTKTGERVWQLRLKGPFSGSPVLAGAHLYAVNENGLAQVVDVTKPEGEIISQIELGDTVLSTPAISNGGFYVRSEGRLWKFKKS